MSFARGEFLGSRAHAELPSFHEAMPMCHCTVSAGLFSNIVSSFSLSLIRHIDYEKDGANSMI